MPFGPYILCADIDSRSMFIASTSTGSLPTPWVASVWKRTPFSRVTLPISPMGLIVPISLLAYITDTSTVLSVIARKVGDVGDRLPFERLAGVEHRLVLGRGRDDVISLVLVELDHALDGEIVRLRGAAREDDLLRLGIDETGDPLAAYLDGLLRFPAEPMAAARGISEDAAQVRHHRLEHPGVEGCRGVVVHVDARAHHTIILPESDNPDPAGPVYGWGFSCQPSDRAFLIHNRRSVPTATTPCGAPCR